MANSHNIIEYSTKWADGSITQKQEIFLYVMALEKGKQNL